MRGCEEQDPDATGEAPRGPGFPGCLAAFWKATLTLATPWPRERHPNNDEVRAREVISPKQSKAAEASRMPALSRCIQMSSGSGDRCHRNAARLETQGGQADKQKRGPLPSTHPWVRLRLFRRPGKCGRDANNPWNSPACVW